MNIFIHKHHFQSCHDYLIHKQASQATAEELRSELSFLQKKLDTDPFRRGALEEEQIQKLTNSLILAREVRSKRRLLGFALDSILCTECGLGRRDHVTAERSSVWDEPCFAR